MLHALSYVATALLITGLLLSLNGSAKRAKARNDEREVKIICPHCHVKGMVKTREIMDNKGVSGGKAAGAVITGGKSVWLTGLSRFEPALRAECRNCHTKWTIT